MIIDKTRPQDWKKAAETPQDAVLYGLYRTEHRGSTHPSVVLLVEILTEEEALKKFRKREHARTIGDKLSDLRSYKFGFSDPETGCTCWPLEPEVAQESRRIGAKV